MSATVLTSLSQRSFAVVQQIKDEQKCRPQLVSSQAMPCPPSEERSAFIEPSSMKAAREQTFTDWPHVTPSAELMSSSGWFWCKVGDRVICIYCDTICHQWTYTDSPLETHSRLAPRCPFVLSKSSKLLTQQPAIVTNHSLCRTLKPCDIPMSDISRRLQSFDNSSWTQVSPSSADLARAGFFYSGTDHVVTCLYCNGSLQHWSHNDNPMIEHARWFPTCLYARHLCGDRFHDQIQVTKKQLAKKKNEIDAVTLARLVNARLDLPVVQRLRTQYSLGIIQRCIEDQLKISQDDFASSSDLAMSCLILQKQLDIIKGDPKKLIVPSENQPSGSPQATLSAKQEECVVCLTEERQIACIPCGHLNTCVPCGYSLKSCPVCREQIQSFVRIYC